MVKIENVTKRYAKRVALDHVNLELKEGVYGLLGPNGSGKTTLLRCMAGVMKQTSGHINCPRNIGYLPQKFGMFKELTLYESMEYFCAMKNVPNKCRHAMIMNCLEQVHLADRAKDKVGSLSGGMVRRMGIAQTLLGNPELILVDEPTVGLDPEERLRFKNMIRQSFAGKTVLISTHIVEDVDSICSDIILLDKGHILTQCSAMELREQAKGKVYSVPVSRRQELQEPYYIIREEYGVEQDSLRVLSPVQQPGDILAPTIEDGYMLHIQGLK